MPVKFNLEIDEAMICSLFLGREDSFLGTLKVLNPPEDFKNYINFYLKFANFGGNNSNPDAVTKFSPEYKKEVINFINEFEDSKAMRLKTLMGLALINTYDGYNYGEIKFRKSDAKYNLSCRNLWLFLNVLKENDLLYQALDLVSKSDIKIFNVSEFSKNILTRWIIDNKVFDDNLIALYLRGFFPGSTKIFLANSLNNLDLPTKLQILFKSKCHEIEIMRFKSMPLELLMFHLKHKNIYIRKIIEERLNNGV